MPRTTATARTGAAARTTVPTTQNLLLYSEQFDHATWSKSPASSLITANQAANPINGAVDADLMSDEVEVGLKYHYVLQAPSPVLTKGYTYTLSVYLKANGAQWVCLNNNGNGAVWFDLINGITGTTSGTNYISSSLTAVSGQAGWYRASMTYTSDGQSALIWITDANGSTSYQGDGTRKVFIWGAQIVSANWAGPYVQTVAAAVNTGAIRSIATVTRTVAS